MSCGKRSQPIQAARIASYEAASSETTSSVTPSGLSIKAAKPVDAYVVLGGKIKTFWFNVASPLLPYHMYRADVSPGGDTEKIGVYETTRQKRPGALAYLIVLEQEDGYTSVKTQNRKMPPEAASKLRYDIERRTHGEASWKRDAAAAR